MTIQDKELQIGTFYFWKTNKINEIILGSVYGSIPQRHLSFNSETIYFFCLFFPVFEPEFLSAILLSDWMHPDIGHLNSQFRSVTISKTNTHFNIIQPYSSLLFTASAIRKSA